MRKALMIIGAVIIGFGVLKIFAGYLPTSVTMILGNVPAPNNNAVVVGAGAALVIFSRFV